MNLLNEATLPLYKQSLANKLAAGGILTADEVKSLVAYTEKERGFMEGSYLRYSAKNLQINTKAIQSEFEPNRINNDYRRLIVDQCAAYIAGNAINYNYTDDEDMDLTLNDVLRANKYEQLDLETFKLMGACGVAYRLIENSLEMKNLDAWHVIYLENQAKVACGAIVLSYALDQAGEIVVQAEVYSANATQVYHSKSSGAFYHLEELAKPNVFSKLQVIQFKNNQNLASDFESVESLIDKYDDLLSMGQDAMTQFNFALMAIYLDADDESEFDAKKISKSTVAVLNGANSKIEYVTKNIPKDFFDCQLQTLNDNIYRFSQSIDMSSDNFTGASGEARRWKLIELENKAVAKQQQFRAGMLTVFELMRVVSILTKNKSFNPLWVDMKFNRNLPSETTEAVETVEKLQGLVSKETLLAQLPFVSDVQAEVERLEKESDNHLYQFKLDEDVTDDELA